MLIEFNKDNMEEIIKNNETVLFFFHKDNCARCETLLCEINKYLENNDLDVYSIDSEKYLNILRKNNIYAIPALLLYKNQKLIYRNLGYINFLDIINLLN